MARRRLSDLLREEANKPSDDATATAGADQPADEPDAETLDAEILDEETSDVTEETATTPTKASTAAKHTSTKRTGAAEPPATIAQKQDETLQQQIAELTAALEAQKVMVGTLQTELKQMNALKAELEQTRKEALKLAESNTKLTQELKALQSQKTKAPTTKAEPRQSQELQLAPSPTPVADSVAASGHPLNTFNRDVGWFD